MCMIIYMKLTGPPSGYITYYRCENPRNLASVNNDISEHIFGFQTNVSIMLIDDNNIIHIIL